MHDGQRNGALEAETLRRDFVIFSDYARRAIRLSALMELPVVIVFTHDAMGDGEYGPTHRPIEPLAALRAIPGLATLRPGDTNEVVEAYRYVMQLRQADVSLLPDRDPGSPAERFCHTLIVA